MRRYLMALVIAAAIGVGSWAAWLGVSATTGSASTQPTTKEATITVQDNIDVTFTLPNELRHGADFVVPVRVSEGTGNAPRSIEVIWSLQTPTGDHRSGNWRASLQGTTPPRTGQFLVSYPVGLSKMTLNVRIDSGERQKLETTIKVRHESASGDWRYINPAHVSRIDADFGDGTIIYYWDSGNTVTRKMTEHEKLSGNFHHSDYGNRKDGDHFTETHETNFFAWEHIRN